MKKVDKDLKKIVLASIESYDDDWSLSIGGNGTFNKSEILNEVENESEIGQKVVMAQKEYTEALVNGKIFKMINTL
jgi:hypothetical protein